MGDGGITGVIPGNVTNNGTLIFNRSNQTVFGGTISGTGSLIQRGTGDTVLTGSNNYSGGTTIEKGVLQLGNGFLAGSMAGDVTVNAAGLLRFNQPGTFSFAGDISGDGSLEQWGASAITLSGSNNYSGGTTVSNGSLIAAVAGALPDGTPYTVNGGTLDLNDLNLTMSSLQGTGGTVALGTAALTVDQSGNTAFAGVITGTGSLAKSGNGTLVWSGASDYSGGTTISAGTLQIGNGGTTGSISGDVTNNGTLAFNRSNALTFTGDISGTGTLIQRGIGTTVLTGTGSHDGGTTVEAGTLQIGNGGTTGSITGDVTNNGTLAFNRSNTFHFAGEISGTGALIQRGNGTTILTGGNSHDGGTTVEAGTLQIGNGGTTGSISGDVTNNGTMVFNRSDALSFAGEISGTGALIQRGNGTTILTGANSHDGGTTVEAGTLQIGNGGTIGSITGDVTNNGTLVFNRSDALSFAGDISGTGALVQRGNGTTVLTGASSHDGGTTVEAGTLQIGNGGTTGSISGDVTNNGILAFNHSDALSFAGEISGTGTLIQRGIGTTVLTGANSHDGGTTVEAGTLQIGNGGTTGSITGDVTNNGTLAFNRSNTFHFAGEISGTGALIQRGNGTTILTGGNSHDGGTTVEAGTLQIGNGGTTGSITGDVTNNGILAFNRSDALSFAGDISGTGGLIQRGNGTTILTGASNHEGGTAVEAGTLQIGNGGTTGSISGDVTNNGILAFNRSDALSFAGEISGTGALIQRGNGTTVLTGASKHDGGTTVEAGTLQIGNGGTTGSITGDVTNNGILAFNRSDALNFAEEISGTGALIQRGNGTTILTGANSHDGGTMVEAGTLQIGNGGTTGSISGDVTNNGILAFNRSDALSFAGEISGTGALIQRGNGTTILTGANSHDGGTTVEAGTLQIGDGGTTGSITGDVTNNGTLAFNRSDTLNFAGGVSGTGALIQRGNGTTFLTGSNSYTGGTRVDSGTLVAGAEDALVDNTGYRVNGTLDLSGHNLTVSALAGSGTVSGGTVTVAPGGSLTGLSGQTLTTASLILSPGSVTRATLGGGGNAGLFQVYGDLTLAGRLDLTSGLGFGDGVYRLFDYGGTLTNNGYAMGSVPMGARAALQSLTESKQVNVVVKVDGPVTDPEPEPAPVPSILFWNGDQTGSRALWSAGETKNWTDSTGVGSFGWNGKFAVFQHKPGTVTVSTDAGRVAATGVQFIGNGWTLTGDNLTLNGADGATSIRVGDGSANGRDWSATISAGLTGSSRLVKDDLGTLILTGANSYTGGTRINTGTLQLGDGGTSGSILGDVANNGTLAFNRSDDTRFDGSLSGTGQILHTGSGQTNLTGRSTGFTGLTRVSNGTLAVNGTLGGWLEVDRGGRLQGSGTVGSTTISGVVAPGNSIGTLTVAGDITFNSGAVYQVEANAAGQSDRITATGKASLHGGTVQVLAGAGTYAPETSYTILSAEQGVSGRFSGGVTSNLAFLVPSLNYDANSVSVQLKRNDLPIDDVAETPNQSETGGVVAPPGIGGAGNPVHDALLGLSAEQARNALEQLSGAQLATARSALIEHSRFVRGAANDRLRAAAGTAAASRMPVVAYGSGSAPHQVSPDHDGVVFWTQGYGSWGSQDGDGNVSALRHTARGGLAGLDGPVGGWRLGALAGYSQSRSKSRDHSASVTSDGYHVGLYGGTSQGALSLRGGLGYSWHNGESSRTVAFPGLYQQLKAERDTTSLQAFAELGYDVQVGQTRLEPFASLAHVRLRSDASAERGGAAALTTAAASSNTSFSTLGLRAEQSLELGQGKASLNAMVGWRRAFGDTTPKVTQHFAWGDEFAATGLPIAQNSAVVELGLDLNLATSTTLSLSYSGQLAADARENGIRANLSVRF